MKRIYIAWILVFLCLLTALGVGLLSVYVPAPTADGQTVLQGIAVAGLVVGGIGMFFLVIEALMDY